MLYSDIFILQRGFRRGNVLPPPPDEEPDPQDDFYKTYAIDYADMVDKQSKFALDAAGTGNYPALRTAVAKSKSSGDGLLNFTIYSVTNKPDVVNGIPVNYGPNTDKRNGYSLAIYWHPRTANRLSGDGVTWVYDGNFAVYPYVPPIPGATTGQKGSLINGTGEPYVGLQTTNPEAGEYKDTKTLQTTCQQIKKVAVAYFYTKDEKYAQRTLDIIYSFFLDPVKGMLPNVKFSGVVRDDVWGGYGIGSGFVEWELLSWLVESFQMIRLSQTVKNNPAKEALFIDWIQAFFDYSTKTWATPPVKPTASSTFAQKEDYYHWKKLHDTQAANGIYAQWNNIRVLHERLIMNYALFLGNRQWVIDRFTQHIFDYQGKDGVITRNFPATPGTYRGINYRAHDMPLEMWRPIPWSYSLKCLDGWVELCRIGEYVGVDVANHVTTKGSSLKFALNNLLDYLDSSVAYPAPKQNPRTDALYFGFSLRARPLTYFYKDSNPALHTRMMAYLNSLDTWYGITSEHSETYFRQGKNLELLTQKIGYTW